MWDILGLECLFDVDEALVAIDNYEKQKIVSILKDERPPIRPDPIPLQLLILRAKYNSQRHYEIYEFCSTLSYSDIKSAFQDCPQVIVDWIRKNGHVVYSDKITKQVII